MEQVSRRAYAKINLLLDIIGRRENGYHDVSMIMQTVGIYDELTFTKREDEEIHIVIAGENPEELPCDEHNLIWKAAKLVAQANDIHAGMDVLLVKNIPIAAGMAGGSTDAAATILAMNTLFGLQMSMDQMKEIAVRVGADVPFCLTGGTMLSEGIGEELTALTPVPKFPLLVVKPGLSISTKEAYEAFDARSEITHPDMEGMQAAIAKGSVLEIAKLLGNVLEEVSAGAHPIIYEVKEEMIEHGALGALMSGSGPSIFGIYPDEESLERAYEVLRDKDGIRQIYKTYPQQAYEDNM